MFVGHFTEQPWQDPKLDFRGRGGITDLALSNAVYDPAIGADLYNRYIDEKLYCEEVGFDGVMLNEHHSLPACMQGVTNVEAAILARQTSKVKIAILGNILPIWDDPLWLAEQLAMIDMISHGRLIPGWVRGTGRESITHNAVPPYNRERFQESHDFVIKAWTTPGPWRWEGKHYQFRYVNPWCMPLQKPHPPIWIPCSVSPETAVWCAKRHYPMIMLASGMEATKEMFQIYHNSAAEEGYKSGPQNVGYLFKVHVEETEEQALEVGRKYIEGVSNPFQVGNEGVVRSFLQALPGLSSRSAVAARLARLQPQGRGGAGLFAKYEDQLQSYTIITGTPKSVLPKVRHVLDYLRPGSIFFWDGDGSMSHEDQMRSLRLMGEEVIPATREIGKELGLTSPYDVNDGTSYDQAAWARAQAESPRR